jgi:hypothetical protein
MTMTSGALAHVQAHVQAPTQALVHAFAQVLAGTRTDVPVAPTRDEAQAWAAQELARGEYHESRSSAWETFTQSVRDAVNRFIESLLVGSARHSPGTVLAVVLVVVVIAVVVAVLVVRSGGLRSQSHRGHAAVFTSAALTAADHRLRSESAAAEGDWAQAVAERFRAVVRAAEEIQVLHPRPGRTADEAAAEIARAVPETDPEVLTAARVFDEVRYGDRGATEGQYDLLRTLDGTLTRARAARREVAS